MHTQYFPRSLRRVCRFYLILNVSESGICRLDCIHTYVRACLDFSYTIRCIVTLRYFRLYTIHAGRYVCICMYTFESRPDQFVAKSFISFSLESSLLVLLRSRDRRQLDPFNIFLSSVRGEGGFPGVSRINDNLCTHKHTYILCATARGIS